jgi:hypothetical protein
MFRAGRFATVQTRSIGSQDHLCGNEETFYPPLTQLAHSVPAVALTDAYGGPGLGVSWDLHIRPLGIDPAGKVECGRKRGAESA